MDEIAASDARLLTRASRGDERAFLDLYRRYRRPVFQFAWRLTGSEAAAEDIAQECFLALLEGAAYDPEHGAMRTYFAGDRAAQGDAADARGNASPVIWATWKARPVRWTRSANCWRRSGRKS